MYKVTANIIHGGFHDTATGEGNTIADALDEVLKTSPSARGYGPTTPRARRQIIHDLELDGVADHGWVEYDLATLPRD